MSSSTIGGATGNVSIEVLPGTGIPAERPGGAMLVGAIAAPYPVLAVAANAPTLYILMHCALFAGLAAATTLDQRGGLSILAFCLAAYGILDMATMWASHSGPASRPTLFAGHELAAGLFLLWFARQPRNLS